MFRSPCTVQARLCRGTAHLPQLPNSLVIPRTGSTFHFMKPLRNSGLGCAVAAFMVFACSRSASNAAVIPLDKFDIAVVGFNSSNERTPLTTVEDATFGQTQTYPDAALASQTVTVSSSEVVGPITTRDNITISVPTDFAPAGTLDDGSPIEAMYIDIGGFFFGTDRLNFVLPINTAAYNPSLTVLFGTSAKTNINFYSAFSDSNAALSTAAFAPSSGSDASGQNIRSFSATLSYPTTPLPEPAGIGFVLAAGATLLRWRTKKTPTALTSSLESK